LSTIPGGGEWLRFDEDAGGVEGFFVFCFSREGRGVEVEVGMFEFTCSIRYVMEKKYF